MNEGPFSIIYRMIEVATRKPYILRVIPTLPSPAEHSRSPTHLGNLWSAALHAQSPASAALRRRLCHGRLHLLLREFVEGTSLQQLIDDPKAMEEERVRDWAVQLCDLLYLLHNREHHHRRAAAPGRVHRQRGAAAGGRLRTARVRAAVAQAAMVKEWLGGLAAPEVLRRQTLRPSTDVYALGALMHYLLTRVRPRGPSSPFTMLAKYREDVGRDMNRMVMRMLQFSARWTI